MGNSTALVRTTARRAASLAASIFLVAGPLLAAPLVVGPGVAAADPAPAPSCPYQLNTPPAVDASEVPAPGDDVPTPLPVPAKPVGGAALGDCGIITAANTGPVPGDVSAEAWLVADLDTGEIVAARDPHGRHRPASIIKVLVATQAINDLNLNKPIAGTAEDAAAEGTKVGVDVGGTYTVNDLLHGLLMHSGNDAAHALAGQLGGMDATLGKLNTLASKLGARDTRVATPSGLDGPGMSTSAYDIGLFYRYAWTKPEFAQVVATRSYMFPGHSTPEAGDHPAYELENDNKLLTNYDGALGGKTGYTDDAGQTFVGAAERDGRRLVAVLLHGTRVPIAPWEQTARLLDYGFSTPRGTSVGTLVEPDPSLTQPAADDAPVNQAASLMPAADATPVRVGVGLVGTLVVFSLIMGARSLNRNTARA